MVGDFDAIGEAVTGAMLGRAVEPQAGEASDGHTHEKSCLNCGTKLSGAYCSNCGQKAHIHRSVRAFFQDFLAGLFNFEGKIWRTLPMLAWRPGEMTRRYIAPIALYLFTVFAMFAVLNFTGALGSGSGAKHVPNTLFQTGLQTGISDDQKDIANLQLKRKTALAAGRKVSDIDVKIAAKQQDIADIQKVMNGKAIASGQADDGTPSWIRPF